MWAVGILVVCVIAITVVIPVTLGVITGANPVTAVSAELWTGTAATAHAMVHAPMLSVTTFKKATKVVTVNTTALVGADGTVRIPIDTYAVNNGVAWSNMNVTINNTGSNATTYAIWLGSMSSLYCNAANKTLATLGSDTWSGIASSCLTPGADLQFKFANITGAGQVAPNVTGVSLSYFKYVDNAAYTVDLVPGTITPTATGYYYTNYTYGSSNMTTTTTILLLVPLLIALAVLLIVIKPLG